MYVYYMYDYVWTMDIYGTHIFKDCIFVGKNIILQGHHPRKHLLCLEAQWWGHWLIRWPNMAVKCLGYEHIFTCRTFVLDDEGLHLLFFSNVIWCPTHQVYFNLGFSKRSINSLLVVTSQPPNGTTHFPTLPIISSPSCLQDLRPSPCDANDLQWQRHQQHLAYLKSLGSSKLSRYLTKGNDWLHKFAEVKPTAWQWKTQKEDFHRCQRPKRLRHISLRLKSQSTPLLHDGSKMEACGK